MRLLESKMHLTLVVLAHLPSHVISSRQRSLHIDSFDYADAVLIKDESAKSELSKNYRGTNYEVD